MSKPTYTETLVEVKTHMKHFASDLKEVKDNVNQIQANLYDHVAHHPLNHKFTLKQKAIGGSSGVGLVAVVLAVLKALGWI